MLAIPVEDGKRQTVSFHGISWIFVHFWNALCVQHILPTSGPFFRASWKVGAMADEKSSAGLGQWPQLKSALRKSWSMGQGGQRSGLTWPQQKHAATDLCDQTQAGKLKSAQRFRTVKRARERSECGTYHSCHWSQVDANKSVTTCCSICSICLWFRAWSTFMKPLVLNGVFPLGWTETKKAQTKTCKTFCHCEHVYLCIFNLRRHRTMLEHKIPGETLKIISNKRADRPQTCCRR